MCTKITIFHSIPFRSQFLLLLQRVVSGLSSSLHVYYILTFSYSSSVLYISSLASSVVYSFKCFSLCLFIQCCIKCTKTLDTFIFFSYFPHLTFCYFYNKLHCCFVEVSILCADIYKCNITMLHNNVLLCFLMLCEN